MTTMGVSFWIPILFPSSRSALDLPLSTRDLSDLSLWWNPKSDPSLSLSLAIDCWFLWQALIPLQQGGDRDAQRRWSIFLSIKPYFLIAEGGDSDAGRCSSRSSPNSSLGGRGGGNGNPRWWWVISTLFFPNLQNIKVQYLQVHSFKLGKISNPVIDSSYI